MSKIKNIYRKLYRKYGDSPISVKARDKKQQYSRFKNLLRCCEISKNDTNIICKSIKNTQFFKNNRAWHKK